MKKDKKVIEWDRNQEEEKSIIGDYGDYAGEEDKTDSKDE